jgi:hypothetical protein
LLKLLIALGISFLPIWRPAAGWKGQNLWQFARTTIFAEQLEHITIEEAIEEARIAYCEVMGLDYNQSYSEPHVSRIALIPEILFAGATAMSLPFWRSGLHEGITGWEWAYHHTRWGPPVTHIPREEYLTAFQEAYGD